MLVFKRYFVSDPPRHVGNGSSVQSRRSVVPSFAEPQRLGSDKPSPPTTTKSLPITQPHPPHAQYFLPTSCQSYPRPQLAALSPTQRPSMNTISPPPQFKRISGPKRALGVVVGISLGLGANVLLAYSTASFYTRSTKFVPFDVSSPDLTTSTFRKHNPAGNPPVTIDHAVKGIPYGKLPQKYWITGRDGRISVDRAQLTTDFCRGVWGGLAYRVQRRYLERKYRALPGREGQLWDAKELQKSDYGVGTKITDHFEVVEHSDDKVIVRCGDSPLNQDPRPSDGLFSMEVSTDDDAQMATFHLKSLFVDTTPEGKNSQPLPWNFQYAHRWYTKLWMESATRKLLKDA
ncbi:predicted protein [Plenodomus lingam JN3]|uniref:Uncharacterized protein n=2 Tax=Leptosphaeria maculans TaxID=5022 RepID=E5A5T5_LEPMJ|nr:predicted protein [Plenodomus lingam JN3]CBX98980.1 predicted protein [Plenodomus lingam JN3]